MAVLQARDLTLQYDQHRVVENLTAEIPEGRVTTIVGANACGKSTGRNVDELSGGQRQRVWIAMALAQETDVLLLDEPTTYLDLAHQVEVLDLVTDLNPQRGTTVAIVLHDLNLAARYADHVIALKAGRTVAEGASSSVITEELVRNVFGLESRVVPDPVSGTPLIIPLGRHHALPRSSDHDPGDGLMSAVQNSSARTSITDRPGFATEPMTLAFDVTVSAVQELSPSFRRVTFGGYSLRDFGVHGDSLDLRIKHMIPSLGPDGSRLPLTGSRWPSWATGARARPSSDPGAARRSAHPGLILSFPAGLLGLLDSLRWVSLHCFRTGARGGSSLPWGTRSPREWATGVQSCRTGCAAGLTAWPRSWPKQNLAGITPTWRSGANGCATSLMSSWNRPWPWSQR